MTTTTDRDDAHEDILDITTSEYPALVEGTPPPALPLNGSVQTARPDGESAAFWLTYLETEVSRLHANWQSIDSEFKTRQARVAELSNEVQFRAGTIEKLTADLRSGADALKVANERIAARESEVAELIGDARERDAKVAELTTAISAAEERRLALLQTLQATLHDAERLDASLRREKEASAGLAEHNEALVAEKRDLQSKLQDLETYINGRHQIWSDLNAQLADYKSALAAMERTAEARDASVVRFDEEKKQLAARVLDLERQCAELTARRAEREHAYDELQEKLTDHLETMQQLEAEHANRAKETEQALATAGDKQKLVDSLERGVARRDETLTALSAELEQHKVFVGEMSGTNEKLLRRTDELERMLHERIQQTQELREELRASHEVLQTLREQLGERDTQLAASRDAADEKGRLADRLAHDLHSLEKGGAVLRSEIARIEEHSAELKQVRDETIAESDRVKTELAAQRDLVASLEKELRAKQATEDLLERNVGRITDLGASMAALDRQMAGSEPRSADPRFRDFVETVASDAASDSDESRQMRSLEALIRREKNEGVWDVGEPSGKPETARKLVVLLGARSVEYPLVKQEMTIGRGSGSDIRISSHFISRIHAKVSTSAIATVIEDAGSKNGVLVNSERVQRRALRDGDIVSLGGEVNLRFVDGAPRDSELRRRRLAPNDSWPSRQH